MENEVIKANVLYFLNTGDFYAHHKLLRDALEMFEGRTTKEELQNYHREISSSLYYWVGFGDYKKVMGHFPYPTPQERKLIALEILDHWTDGKLTEQLEALI